MLDPFACHSHYLSFLRIVKTCSTLTCQVAEHCWDLVGLVIVEYAYRFQRLTAVSGQG